jgi:hypothetical protein
MSHTSREKLDLANRPKKIIGQLEDILRALNDDEQCADVADFHNLSPRCFHYHSPTPGFAF